jgi:hypothetical protein
MIKLLLLPLKKKLRLKKDLMRKLRLKNNYLCNYKKPFI